jgi:hypothetical protein
MIRIKRLIQTTTVLLFFIILSSCRHAKNDWTKEHLSGKVKSIEESYHPVTNDTLGIKAFYVYNEDGNLLEKKLYCKNNLLYNVSFVYNDKGNLTERNQYNGDSLQEKVKYQLANDGNILQSIDYNLMLHTIVKFEYQYDSRNNAIEVDGWNSTDSLTKTHTLKNLYEYDGKDNVINEKHFDINGILTEMQTSKYNDNNHLISSEIFTKGNNPENQKLTYSYDFDKMNNWVNQRIFNNDTLIGIKARAIEYY